MPDPVALRALVGPPFEIALPGLGLTDGQTSVAVAAYRGSYDRVAATRTPLFPGVPEFLGKLGAAGLRPAVATSQPEYLARWIVEGVGIDEHFTLVGRGRRAEMTRAARRPSRGSGRLRKGRRVSTDVSARIQQILDERRQGLPPLRSEIAVWREVDEQLGELDAAVMALRDHAGTPDELRERLTQFRVEDARDGIAEALRLLRVLESRFSRDTVNIGVSGQARVGKSTLLQSVSGLSDDQIPTGQGLAVTAVRSRIQHSATVDRATLRMHTFGTFVADVVAPYHAELGLTGLPAAPAEFRTWSYPTPGADERGDDTAGRPSYATMLNRLRDMQASISTFVDDLTGGERVVGLDELRRFVAYPTNDELRAAAAAGGTVHRRYLAVRDARIECRFPELQVENLAIVDLPGLGEVAVRAEAHHVDGLQDEVDVVLLVKRAVEGMAYWGGADARALDLLDIARGFAAKRDFVFLLINRGGTAAALQDALRDDIRRQVNIGRADQFFRVVEADAADPADVHKQVLVPVLDHLADRMSTMDADVVAGTRAQLCAAADRVAALAADLDPALASVSPASGSVAEDLDRRTSRLRQDLTGDLVALVGELHEQTRNAAEDPEYVAAVEEAFATTRAWITAGLGVDERSWKDEGLRTMRVDRGSGRYAGEELNRVRVEISTSFEGLDVFFDARVAQLWNRVAASLSPHLGELLAGLDGEHALRRLAELLDGASEPCPRLSRAVQALLAVRLDYRSQLHPRVRAELDGLSLQVTDPHTGDPRTQIVVEATEAGVEELYQFVVRKAERAAHLTKKALLREGVTPALVLHAAAEQFEDVLIRSGDSEREFKRLARSYRDEVWPGVYGEIDAANARIARVRRARETLLASLAAMPGGNT